MVVQKTFHTFYLLICHVLIVGCLLGALVSCANKKDDENKSERQLYEAAQKALDNHQYEFALDSFRKLELRFPFGRYAEQAQLEMIYAYYMNDELAAADVAAQRFIRQHPDHPNLDYAWYMKGLSNYHVDSSFTDRLVKRGSVKRDLSAAKDAFDHFNALIQNFPESEYLHDAQKRMLYLKDVMAQQEIEIAYYYLQRTAYVAALNRGKQVLEKFPGTSASADALAIMVHAYHQMDMDDLAADALAVLKYNFPDYPKLQPDGSLAEYDKLYYDKVNWLNFASFGFLGKGKGFSPVKTLPEQENTEIPLPPEIQNPVN